MRPRGFAARQHLVCERADVYMLDFEPRKGDETPGDHPACIISPREYNRIGMAIVVPMTHSHLSSPFAVEIPAARGLAFDGYAHPDRLRAVAYRERNPRKIGVMPDDLMLAMLAIIRDLIIPPELCQS